LIDGVDVDEPVVIVGIVVELASLAYRSWKLDPPEKLAAVYTV